MSRESREPERENPFAELRQQSTWLRERTARLCRRSNEIIARSYLAVEHSAELSQSRPDPCPTDAEASSTADESRVQREPARTGAAAAEELPPALLQALEYHLADSLAAVEQAASEDPCSLDWDALMETSLANLQAVHFLAQEWLADAPQAPGT